jgi:hypothetical protein
VFLTLIPHLCGIICAASAVIQCLYGFCRVEGLFGACRLKHACLAGGEIGAADATITSKRVETHRNNKGRSYDNYFMAFWFQASMLATVRSCKVTAERMVYGKTIFDQFRENQQSVVLYHKQNPQYCNLKHLVGEDAGVCSWLVDLPIKLVVCGVVGGIGFVFGYAFLRGGEVAPACSTT